MEKIIVLIAEFDDNSGYDVVRAYSIDNSKQAESDKIMLQKHSDKIIQLVECDFFTNKGIK